MTLVKTIRDYSAPTNLLINGGFDFWQRGTSVAFSGASSAYRGSDRWQSRPGGASPAGTVSRDTDVPSNLFSFSIKSVGTGGGSGITWAQKIEAAVIKPYIGQTMTFSIWLKQGQAASAYKLQVLVPSSGIADSWNVDLASETLFTAVTPSYGTNVWAQVSLTFTVPTSAQFGMAVSFDGASTNGTTSWAAGAMLTPGSTVPTIFQRAGVSLQQELAMCQRYYWQINADASTGAAFAHVVANSTTAFQGHIRFPVTMRAVPTNTTTFTSGTPSDYRVDGNTTVTATGITASAFTTHLARFTGTVAAGLTTAGAYELIANSGSSGLFRFDSEL